MKLIYSGKTKDVYQTDKSDILRFAFTDKVTKNDQGEIDPGGNIASGATVRGQAWACLAMTSAVFKELQNRCCNTHMVDFDINKLTMDAKQAVMFKPGLEWVGRWRCTGSFMRRYKMVPNIIDGMVLHHPVYEITLKDDAAGDPLIVPSAIIGLGIMTNDEMEKLWTVNKKTLNYIWQMFKDLGLDLWDIKIEWGFTGDNIPTLIDEIGPGSCRAFKSGTQERVDGIELAKYFAY